MAIRDPYSEWKPFTGKGTSSLTPDIICAHTMVGKLIGSWDWANQAGNSYWHYGLGANGRLLQCQPLEYRSAANLDGNWHVIPIETEDGYPDGKTSDSGQVWSAWSGSNVPSWTTAQINRLVELIAWLCVKFNIPASLIPDTKPGRRGLAYHRQGIDPWRVSGGEKWSNSTGKVCPGDRRLAQFRDIVIPEVQRRLSSEENDVTEDDHARIAKVVRDEVVRAVQALGLGQSNAVYSRSGPPWDALVDLPAVKAAAEADSHETSGASVEQVRDEVVRGVQALGLGQSNAVYDRGSPPWDALVDLPQIKAALDELNH